MKKKSGKWNKWKRQRTADGVLHLGMERQIRFSFMGIKIRHLRMMKPDSIFYSLFDIQWKGPGSIRWVAFVTQKQISCVCVCVHT
jgi:hypothetical protein